VQFDAISVARQLGQVVESTFKRPWLASPMTSYASVAWTFPPGFLSNSDVFTGPINLVNSPHHLETSHSPVECASLLMRVVIIALADCGPNIALKFLFSSRI